MSYILEEAVALEFPAPAESEDDSGKGSPARSMDGSERSPSDETLLARYRDQGREDDFSELIRRYERELFRYLARYLNDVSLAEDVFQNTFLQVHLKRSMYEDGRPVRPWLYTIATHQAVDALRKTRRRPMVSLDQPAGGSEGDADPRSLVELLTQAEEGPLGRLELEERREVVRNAVAKLPDTLRQTLILAYFQELKYREIAEIQGIPVGTVKSRLHAALARLHDSISEALAEERAGD